MKFIALGVIAGVAGTLGFTDWHGNRVSDIPGPSASACAAAASRAGSSDMAVLRMPGEVRPRVHIPINALVSLPIVELPVKAGDRVTKGAVLARLDDTELQVALRCAQAKRDAQAAEVGTAQLRLKALESTVASSRICMDEAQRNWERFKELSGKKCVSQAASDEARSKFDRLRAEYEAAARGYAASQVNLDATRQNLNAAEAELERARLTLAKATIRSPMDGVVTRVNVRPGEIVQSVSEGNTVLMEVADMDHLDLVAKVSEEAMGQVSVGQRVTVRLRAYPKESFTGTVSDIALESTPGKDGTSSFASRIALDTGGRAIAAGLSGEAEIE